MAVIIIIAILTTGLILIATENVHKMNKAAVAMFMGAICWVLYLAYGKSFVVSEHQIGFLSYISEHPQNAMSVTEFIAQNIFVKYIRQVAEIVLYLLGTMTIVEVLNNNGCFDFFAEWVRTRSARLLLWLLAIFTFLLSANLDNLTTACLMLGIMHTLIGDARLRMIYGSVVVFAAACGGAFTVIGDVTSLTLWLQGLVSPTSYAAVLVLPCFVAMCTVLLLVHRKLPRTIQLVRNPFPYRGDDTVLTRWQRLLMLFVGVGGLWFVPTFHRLTLLPPFVGAFCVLALLWIVNELCNRKLMGSGRLVQKRHPMVLEYANLQHMLFFAGLTLAFGALTETGFLEEFFKWSAMKLRDIYVIGWGMGALSAVFNNVTTVLANTAVYAPDLVATYPELASNFGEGGQYWPLLSFSTAMGSSLLCIGTLAGYALMRMEGVTLGWYVRHFSGKVFVGWNVGLMVYWLMCDFPF